jgi:hypothetical protein
MRFRATPAPSGAAALLVLGLEPDATALVIATASPTPPDPSNPGASDRIVIDPSTTLRPTVWPFEAKATHDLVHWQHLDLDRSLADTVTHYHAWAVTSTTITGPITHEVDARAPARSAVVAVVRDFMRARLDYHLARAVTSGRLRPRAGFVPVLELETLNQDDPLPCVLMKETLSPTSLEGIGKHRNERTDANGDVFTQEVHRYRARVDLLALSEQPAERTLLASVLHEGILTDRTLIEDVGYREVMVQRMMRSATTPDGRWQFAEDITVDGIIEAVTEERQQYRVSGSTTFYTGV